MIFHAKVHIHSLILMGLLSLPTRFYHLFKNHKKSWSKISNYTLFDLDHFLIESALWGC